jgi:GH15 family glucan-1,4-alpha-glucosidase
MAWVGLDRFLRQGGLHGGVEQATLKRLTTLRTQIHDEVCAEGYHPGIGTFVEYFGGQELDASLLLLPLVGFLPVEDPRISGTIAKIERELMEDGLVMRKPPQGREHEGAFLACTCWLADCRVMQGRNVEAREALERVLALRNDLGLLSEQYDVRGRHLSGNFPQALSHLAVVMTALGLSGPVLQRGR